MKTLHALFSEKEGMNKLTEHSYISVYAPLLCPVRQTRKPIVEVGIGGGGSIKVWQEYFPNAPIHGVDKSTEQFERLHALDRVFCHKMNAYTEAFKYLCCALRPIVLIDEGSRSPRAQAWLVEHCLPLLPRGGMLFIGNINDPEFLIELAGGPTFKWDFREETGIQDDVLFLYRRPGR